MDPQVQNFKCMWCWDPRAKMTLVEVTVTKQTTIRPSPEVSVVQLEGFLLTVLRDVESARPLPAEWPWVTCFISQSLSLLNCKMGIPAACPTEW